MHILFCVNNIKFGTKCFVKVEQFVLPFIGNGSLKLDTNKGDYGNNPTGVLAEDSQVIYLSLIHISEPTRQAEISYAVFCLKKKKKTQKKETVGRIAQNKE